MPMPEHALVSVCMPVFNGMPFLAEAIGSVLAQDYENFELVISLDPSTDGSSEYCHSLRDPRVKLIENRKPGLFSNLNNAIKSAKGAYIQVFGQDDIMRVDYVRSQVAGFARWPGVSLVVGRDCAIDEQGRIGEPCPPASHREPMPTQMFMWQAAHFGSMASNISCAMIARSALERAGLFDESYRYAGDIEFYIRMATVGPVLFESEPKLFVRSHPAQTSRSVASSNILIDEERRIYSGFWKDAVLSKRQAKAIWRFYQKTRGAYHFRTAGHWIKSGRIAAGMQILFKTFRVYGVFNPTYHGLIRGAVSPGFQPDDFRLGDVAEAARKAALAGQVPRLG